MDVMNVQLANAGVSYRAAKAEYVSDAGTQSMGNTVLAKDVGNKQLDSDFVPGDPRRTWGNPAGGITYAIDTTPDAVPFAGGLTQPETDAAIERAIASWDGLTCSTLPLSRTPYAGPIGVLVGDSPPVADVMHGGWRDLEFGGGVLGVAFTFIFIDTSQLPDIVPTDIDGNRKSDTAFSDIYYDPLQGFFGPPRVWSTDGVTNIDVESVAVHEMGHGLSQAHFGTVRFKNNGDLMASPRAIMNAIYAGPFRALTGTDNGGHCSNWANWPNN